MITALITTCLITAPTAIENVTVLIGDGHALQQATVVFDAGKITAVGPGVAIPGANQFTYTIPSVTIDMNGSLFSVNGRRACS